MKFNKLSKEKRNQLVLVVVGTVAVLAGIGFGLIKYQQDQLRSLGEKKAAAEVQLKRMQDTVKRAELVKTVFAEASESLAQKELGMASGDHYSWMFNTVRRFQRNYKVDVPQLSPINQPTDVNLLPKFPYKQAVMQIGGTAYYHDLGQFIADFENDFPFMRVANLTIDLNQSPASGDVEKLSFKMDLITLVKSSQR